MGYKDTVNFKRTILTEGELDADGQESCSKNKKRFLFRIARYFSQRSKS